eukprot:185456-Amphidinium_carterae.1
MCQVGLRYLCWDWSCTKPMSTLDPKTMVSQINRTTIRIDKTLKLKPKVDRETYVLKRAQSICHITLGLLAASFLSVTQAAGSRSFCKLLQGTEGFFFECIVELPELLLCCLVSDS